MDKTQQRIKIAEACGWKPCGWRPIHSSHKPTDLALGGTEEWWRLAEENTVARLEDLPDYPNDLNAMHEAEKVLDENLLYRYGNKLDDITRIEEIMEMSYVNGPEAGMYPELFRATSEQRAEAFLRTLGLWEDEVNNG